MNLSKSTKFKRNNKNINNKNISKINKNKNIIPNLIIKYAFLNNEIHEIKRKINFVKSKKRRANEIRHRKYWL